VTRHPLQVAAGERGSQVRTVARRGSYGTTVPGWEPLFETETLVKPHRGRSLGTKLSEVEYARAEAAALKAGVGLSEWCRRAVLEFAERDNSQPAEKVVLAEVLSLRSVLLSVVFQMSKGQPVSEEEMRRLIERADREKHKKATALLDEGGRDGERR
jgi:hypothetical protein